MIIDFWFLLPHQTRCATHDHLVFEKAPTCSIPLDRCGGTSANKTTPILSRFVLNIYFSMEGLASTSLIRYKSKDIASDMVYINVDMRRPSDRDPSDWQRDWKITSSSQEIFPRWLSRNIFPHFGVFPRAPKPIENSTAHWPHGPKPLRRHKHGAARNSDHFCALLALKNLEKMTQIIIEF